MPLFKNGSNATPGGSDKQVQFNDGGVFGGDAGLVYDKTTDTLSVTGPIASEGASAIGATTPLAAGSIALTLKKTLSSVGAAATLRAWGYSPSIELLDKDSAQNWYFGINDADSDALYIGRGYGPNQGITPAIKVLTTDVVQIAGDLALAANGGVRRNTADGSDTGFICLSAGGAVNDSTRGAGITMTGNEFGSSLDGAIHIAPGNIANNATRIFRGAAGSAIFEVDATGHCRIRDAAGNVIVAHDATNRQMNLDCGKILFPGTQASSSDANCLDDYEEGLWSPTIVAASGVAGGYLDQSGHYVKVGTLVFTSFNVQLNGVNTLSGNVSIGAFPFTSHTSVINATVALGWSALSTSIIGLAINVSNNVTQHLLFYTTAAATGNLANVVQHSDLGANSIIRGVVVYRAAA